MKFGGGHVTKQKMLALIAFSAILVSLGYQNCNKVGVTDTSGQSSGKVSGDGLVAADGNQGDGGGAPGMPSDPMNPSVMGDDDVVMNPPDKENDDEDMSDDSDVPVMIGEDRPGKSEDRGKDKDKDSDKEKERDVAFSKDPSKEMKDPEDECKEDCEVDKEPKEMDAVAICMGGQIKSKKLNKVAGPVIEKVRGGLRVESDTIQTIHDVRGFMVIKGKTSAARIQSISDTRGAMVICGAEVGSIKKSRGQILLVNSKVGSIDDHRGAVRFSGTSEVGSITNIRGNVKEMPK